MTAKGLFVFISYSQVLIFVFIKEFCASSYLLLCFYDQVLPTKSEYKKESKKHFMNQEFETLCSQALSFLCKRISNFCLFKFEAIFSYKNFKFLTKVWSFKSNNIFTSLKECFKFYLFSPI